MLSLTCCSAGVDLCNFVFFRETRNSFMVMCLVLSSKLSSTLPNLSGTTVKCRGEGSKAHKPRLPNCQLPFWPDQLGETLDFLS